MRKEESIDDFKQSIAVKTEKCSPKFGNSRLSKDSNDSQETEVSVRALGGDVTILAEEAEDPEMLQKLREEWQISIKTHPAGYDFKLKPIWLLVHLVNPQLAEKVQKYLTKLWKDEYDKTSNLKFADKIVKMHNHDKHNDVKARLESAKAELDKHLQAFVAERNAAWFKGTFDAGIAHCKTSLIFVEELVKLNDEPTDETDYESKL